MLSDYHVHLRPDEGAATFASVFNAANVERYREAASQAGIAELGVSEHIHRFQQSLAIWDHPYWREQARDDIYAYCEFVREATDLRLGLEVDFVPGREDRTQSLIERCELDYVVGSVHFLGDLAVDFDRFDIWEGARSAEDVWRRYFETLAAAASSGMFDILAHPDLVKMWGAGRPTPPGDRAAGGTGGGGTAVGVAPGGRQKPVGEIYPAPAFLAGVVEAGAPIAL